MATETYIPLATVTLAASSSAVYFTEISQDYSDLVLVVEQTGASGNTSIQVQFNGDSGTNYSNVYMGGNGSTASSSSNTGYPRIQVGGFIEYADGTAKQLAICEINDYSATDKHKTVLTRSNVATGAGSGLSAWAGRWANTSAVTSIALVNQNYAAGSTFKLFGIHGEVV